VSDRITTPYEGRPAVWDDGAPIGAPLRLHDTTAPPEWMDYNDHMSESCFLLAFGDSADAFFRFLGIDEAYRAAGHSLYTSETHLHHRREVALGDPLHLSLQLLDHDRRRLHVFHEMRHGTTGVLLAEAEQLLVHVDMRAGRSSDLPPHLLRRLDAIAAAHAQLPRPDVVGRPMGIRRADG
jgi:carnitine 3-dehydrogenase